MVSEVRASHILVKTEQEANDLLAQIQAGKKFEKLAKKHSDCPSGKNGGDLGFFGRGQMVREFENAAFNMEVGQVSPPVKTQFGYHLIKVTGKK
ncbi:MAG: peptidyl-prolyl cis-trans isomerase [Thermoplasmata archaeon]|nr:MAG: peptidyl-prolyl cis-trans isomerase [Thermoplasmata archaeon]